MTPSASKAFFSLANVFREKKAELQSLHLFDWTGTAPDIYSVSDARHPGEFGDHHRVSWSDASDSVRNAWRRRIERYEDAERKAREKARTAAYANISNLQTVLLATPLYPYASSLEPPIEPLALPFQIPFENRFKHQWIISPTGGGKTTLLESQILKDLELVIEGKCSVVVIDSQYKPGEPSLIPNLAGLKLFAPGQPLDGKLILLEPDPDYPLALNMFDRSQHVPGLTERERDIEESSGAEMIQFCLSAMTDQQDDLFSYVVQFVMTIPEATIDTLRKVLEPKGLDEFREHLERADDTVQTFFKTQFDSTGFKPTREAVLRRVLGVLKNKTFRRMFQSRHNKFNMQQELSEPKVILINTDMAYLGATACQLFGRFFISQIVQMVKTRGAALPVFCYIDEMHDYLSNDENLEFLNDKARKRNVGMIYAHQRLSNIKSDGVRDSLCNCDIQFAGGNRTDAKLLAELLHASAEEIRSTPVGHFMTFVNRKTPKAVRLEVDERMPSMSRMTELEMRQVKQRMRERYARPLRETTADTFQHRAETAPPPNDAKSHYQPPPGNSDKPKAASPKPPPDIDDTDAKPW